MNYKTFTYSKGIDISLKDEGRVNYPEKTIDMACWASHFSFYWGDVHNTSVLDIGAWDGLYSLLALKCGIEVDVHSFEVSDRLFKLMQDNIELNRHWFKNESNESRCYYYNFLPTPLLFERKSIVKPVSLIRIATGYGIAKLLKDLTYIIKDHTPVCYITISSEHEFGEVKTILDNFGYDLIQQVNNTPKSMTESWFNVIKGIPTVFSEGNNIFVFRKSNGRIS